MRYRWARSPLGETASLCSGAQQRRGLSRLTGLPAPRQRYQYRSLGVGTDTGAASSRHEAEPLHTRQLLLLCGAAWDAATACMPVSWH